MHLVLPLQNTLPHLYLAVLANFQAVVAHQGAIVCAYQEEVVVLQVAHEQLQQASAVPATPPAPVHSESIRMALPEKFDGSADLCHGFLRQCENFFTHQATVNREAIGLGFCSLGL